MMKQGTFFVHLRTWVLKHYACSDKHMQRYPMNVVLDNNKRKVLLYIHIHVSLTFN
jgi:hypothetical protein